MILLFILLVVVAFAHYFACYLITIKESPCLKTADAVSVKNETLRKSKLPAIVSVKDKSFWLLMIYVIITTHIAISILDIIRIYFGIYENIAIEIISLVICSLICFTIPSLLSFPLIMLVIKWRHKKNI